MVLADSSFRLMAQKFPRNVYVNINPKLFIQRVWIRNWYAFWVAGAFCFCLWQLDRVYNPYSKQCCRRVFKAFPDFASNNVIFYDRCARNSIRNF